MEKAVASNPHTGEGEQGHTLGARSTMTLACSTCGVAVDLILKRAMAPPPSSPENRRAQPSRQFGGATPPSRCDIPGWCLSGSPNLPAALHLSCADPGDTGGRGDTTRPVQTVAFDSSNRRGGGVESRRAAIFFPRRREIH
ncbi:unnamed protein product [Urochloa humidicola]